MKYINYFARIPEDGGGDPPTPPTPPPPDTPPTEPPGPDGK
jgi:hypothetical protein